MKHLLLPVITAFLVTAAPAAIVLTNFPGPVTTSSGIKGTGGFIPTPISYGFEFTVGGGDRELVTIRLDIGSHLGSVPVTVELFRSTTGPNSATFWTGGGFSPETMVEIAADPVPEPASALLGCAGFPVSCAAVAERALWTVL